LDAYLRKKTVYANASGVSPVALMPWNGPVKATSLE